MALVKYNNNSISAVTAAASIPSGSMVLISTNTVSSGVSSVSITSGIDSTYSTYMVKYINLHSASNNVQPQINFSIDGGSNYNVTKTTTSFYANHTEAAGGAGIGYSSGEDLAQATGTQDVAPDLGVDNDQATCGELLLFNPASTTFVKHFMSRFSVGHVQPSSVDYSMAGYCNVTAAIDAVQFAMASGTFIESKYNTETARILIYNAWWFETIMVFFVINFCGNIKRYQLLRKEKWATLLLHISFSNLILTPFPLGI